VFDSNVHLEARRNGVTVEYDVHRSGCDDAATPQERSMRDSARQLFDVMGDEYDGRGSRVGDQCGQSRDQALTGAEIEPGGGLVEEEHLRFGHEGAGQEDLLPLSFGQDAEGSIFRLRQAGGLEQLAGPGVIGLVEAMPPRLQRRFPSGEDDVVGGLGGAKAPQGVLTDERDATAHDAGVGPAVGLA
jgi:hypothetical protein